MVNYLLGSCKSRYDHSGLCQYGLINQLPTIWNVTLTLLGSEFPHNLDFFFVYANGGSLDRYPATLFLDEVRYLYRSLSVLTAMLTGSPLILHRDMKLFGRLSRRSAPARSELPDSQFPLIVELDYREVRPTIRNLGLLMWLLSNLLQSLRTVLHPTT